MTLFKYNITCLPVRPVIFSAFLLKVFFAGAQVQTPLDTTQIVITFNKTTSLVFPSTIKGVDRGSRDVLAQKASGIENILHIKAARQYFPETNLTVITEDSTLHELRINYSRVPAQLVYHIGRTPGNLKAASFEDKLTGYQMDQLTPPILSAHRRWFSPRDRIARMKLSLRSIHIRDNILFFHVELCNRSNIPYTIEYARLYVRDKVQARRTASQENTIVPLLIKGNAEQIAGRSTNQIIYATDKFTIPRSKRLFVEIYENRGGRNLRLRINNRSIVRSKRI